MRVAVLCVRRMSRVAEQLWVGGSLRECETLRQQAGRERKTLRQQAGRERKTLRQQAGKECKTVRQKAGRERHLLAGRPQRAMLGVSVIQYIHAPVASECYS